MVPDLKYKVSCWDSAFAVFDCIAIVLIKKMSYFFECLYWHGLEEHWAYGYLYVLVCQTVGYKILPNLTKNPAIDANEFIHVAALFLMPVLVFAIILNMIYTILCVVCLTTTCCQNTGFRTAADPLNNDQRFLLLLVCKNVGYNVQTLLLQKLSTIITQKTKKRKITEAGTDNLNF